MSIVAITGAGGFIGKALCASLEAAGDQVIALGRERVDVTSGHALLELARPVDTVVHLAFPTSRRLREADPMAALHETSAGTGATLRFAARCGAGHFVLASSGKVYGLPRELPIAETHPVVPSTFLGSLKRLQEDLVSAAIHSAPMAATALRIFNVYGPGARGGFLVPRLLEAFREGRDLELGDLEHRRDWVHLDDVVAAFRKVILHPPPRHELRALNVGSERSASVAELFEILAAASGRRPALRSSPDPAREGEALEERARCLRLRALGWRPQVELEAGLAALL